MWPAWIEGTAYLILLASPLFIFAAVLLVCLLNAKGRNPAGWVCLIMLPLVIAVLAVAHLRSPEYFWEKVAPPKIEEAQTFFDEYQEELTELVNLLTNLEEIPYLTCDENQLCDSTCDAASNIPDGLEHILTDMEIPQNYSVTIDADNISIADEISGPVRLYLTYPFHPDSISEVSNDQYKVTKLSGGWYLEVLKFP